MIFQNGCFILDVLMVCQSVYKIQISSFITFASLIVYLFSTVKDGWNLWKLTFEPSARIDTPSYHTIWSRFWCWYKWSSCFISFYRRESWSDHLHFIFSGDHNWV